MTVKALDEMEIEKYVLEKEGKNMIAAHLVAKDVRRRGGCEIPAKPQKFC